jgi:hypothetical protein
VLDRQDGEGSWRPGIYQLDGDTLTIYSRHSDEGRPTERDVEQDRVRVEVYKRRKK